MQVMAVGTVVAFWGVSLLLVLTPGADWAYAIGAGLRDRTVLPAVGGLLAGYVALTVVVAAGVAALVARSPLMLTVLTAVGAVYLIWLGVTAIASPSRPATAAESAPGLWVWRAVKGAGISGLNPKALLLFVALLPQFTDPTADWSLGMQIVLLGLVHTLSCAVVYTGVGTGARLVLRARPGAARVISRISGAAMVAIGAALLMEQIFA
jgi:threonine/homoserine/homoserine lactone efflux protein